MKLKNILLLMGSVLLSRSAFSQYAEDALRFSMPENGVTARFRAMGSAQTSLGGDLSALSSNPAGLGLFTRNEINFTTDFTKSNVGATYAGSSLTTNTNKPGFSQAGAVFHLAARKEKGRDLNTGWLSFNFGLGYNRTRSFKDDLVYGGINPKSSFADYLADLSDLYLGSGNPASNSNALPDGTLERMGFRNFLTEYNSAGYFPTTGLNSTQQNSTFSGGSQSEINLAAAGNYNNQLYVGASISLSNLSFNADREFRESGKTRSYPAQPADFAGASYSLSYRSGQSTSGTGARIKAGLIYHASPSFRVGVNLVSPTWYTIDDTFSEVLDTRYVRSNGTAIAPYTNTEEFYDSNYELRTPYKINAGASVIFGGTGLITGDVEFVDYSSIHFSSSDKTATANVNRDISRNYQGAVNARLGAEYKISSVALRGGVNFSGNPYKDGDYSSRIVTAGVGYRKNNFYTDLTYANSSTGYDTRPYSISSNYSDFALTGIGETAAIKDTRNSFYLTFGIRF